MDVFASGKSIYVTMKGMAMNDGVERHSTDQKTYPPIKSFKQRS